MGGGSDLPIPASLAVVGGAAALTLTFAVLLMAWRTPRYETTGGGRPVPPVLARIIDGPAFVPALRACGLVVLAFSVWCATAGPESLSNPIFGIVYVLLWVGLVPASLLFGPFYKAVSPARGLHFLLASVLPVDNARGLMALPRWVGHWPAALGLLAFTWLELVSPDGTTLTAVVTWFASYLAVMLLGAVVFGPDWFRSADPFEVYSTLVGHLSIWGRRPDGGLTFLSPLRNLARVPTRPGLVAVVGVLLGSTAFDSYRDSTTWLRFTQETQLNVTALESILLLGICLLVAAVFWGAVAAPTPRSGIGRRTVPNRLAHSVVPIIVGYMIAHYLTLFVETGQLTMIQASDPLGTGADLFGIADRRVDIWLSLHPTFLAATKVLAIVLGHIVGVIAAHDRAISLLPTRSQTTGQLPLLLVMVAYTLGGLYLLFGL
ncbi:MAG: hypothetical protein ACXWDM_04015 [Nocardioides sp.]